MDIKSLNPGEKVVVPVGAFLERSKHMKNHPDTPLIMRVVKDLDGGFNVLKQKLKRGSSHIVFMPPDSIGKTLMVEWHEDNCTKLRFQ